MKQRRTRSNNVPISQREGSPHEQILSAAAELFMEKGFHAGTVREIGNRLGISQSSLYYHAKSKPQILVDLNQRFMDRLLALVEEATTRSDDPAEQIRGVIVALLNVTARYQAEVTVVLQERRSLPAKRMKPIQRQRDRIDELIDGIIENGIGKGAFRSIDVRLTRLALTGFCNWAYAWYSPGGRFSPDEIADVFTSIFLTGIVAKR